MFEILEHLPILCLEHAIIEAKEHVILSKYCLILSHLRQETSKGVVWQTVQRQMTFHQGLHCLLYLNRCSEKEIKYVLKIITCYTMDHPDLIVIEPVHEISNNVVCAISKASDQPAHTRSLIRAFASRLNIL